MRRAARSTTRNAASATDSGSPANVSTERLWSASLSRSSRVTPGTSAITWISSSMTSGRRPSEKFGTHSTSLLMVASWPALGPVLALRSWPHPALHGREREVGAAHEDAVRPHGGEPVGQLLHGLALPHHGVPGGAGVEMP